MMTKIIKELTAIQKTDEITSKQVLHWANRVQAQRAQKAIIEVAKETRV